MFSSSKNQQSIYLDYNASTPPSEFVKRSLLDIVDIYANPSSTHKAGMKANTILEDSRENIANYLNLDSRKIVFTSSATESNNIVFNSHDGLIITSQGEHSSIIKPISQRQEKGRIIPICSKGYIDLNLLEQELLKHQDNNSNQSILISLCLVNGVNGVISPVDEIMLLVKKYHTLIHWDCTQALGKMSLNMEKLDPDYLVASGHKIGSLKGVGILYYKDKAKVKTLLHGGGQELGVRSGTENILAINSFSQALSQININNYIAHTSHLIDHIHKKITEVITDKQTKEEIFLFSKYSSINIMETISNTILLAMKTKTSAQQFMFFDMENICISIGSACTSSDLNANSWFKSQEPSEVYNNLSKSIIRVSIGERTTIQEIDIFIDKWLSLIGM